MKYKYEKGVYCFGCDNRRSRKEFASFCNNCGEQFVSGRLDSFATLRYRNEKRIIKWYNPSTWSGEKWVFDGVGQAPMEIR